MYYLLIKAYQLLCVLLPFFVLYALLAARRRRRGLAPARGHFVLCLVFAFYLFGVFMVTGAGTLYDWLRMGSLLPTGEINLRPLAAGLHYFGYPLNVILFVPLGFLVPLIWPRGRHLPGVVLGGFAFSLLIEASQLLNHRSTDVDDLIMNTIGALAGYLLFKIFAAITKRGGQEGDSLRAEPLLYVAVLFLGHFLLYNEFGAARLLYHF